MARRSLGKEKPVRELTESDWGAVNSLIEAMGEFTNNMRQSNLPKEVSDLIPIVLRISRYYSETAELCDAVTKARRDLEPIQQPQLVTEVDRFERTVINIIDSIDPEKRDDAAPEPDSIVEQMQKGYQHLKSRLLRAGADGEISIHDLVKELDLLSNIRRIGEQLDKSRRYMADLQAHVVLNNTDEV